MLFIDSFFKILILLFSIGFWDKPDVWPKRKKVVKAQRRAEIDW